MQMTSENYVEHVVRTDCEYTPKLLGRLLDSARLLHAAMGLVTEAGEFLDMLKKHIYYGKPLDNTNAVEETGDILWYAGLATDELRMLMNDIMTININKLKLRYPSKFTEQHAIERDVEAEREFLEIASQYDTTKSVEPVSCLNIEEESWNAIKQAASDSKWIPNDYYINDWVSDVCEYLHNGMLAKSCLELNEFSQRGLDWIAFSSQVLAHIEKYTVPQYGDKGEDQVTEWSAKERVEQAKKYLNRFSKNQREGQEQLDFMKAAHYCQLAADKFKEEQSEVN